VLARTSSATPIRPKLQRQKKNSVPRNQKSILSRILAYHLFMSKHVDMQPLDIETEYSAEWFFPRQKKIHQEDDARSDSQR